jgi:peptidoglycan/xylan/chitin deacetylase (PgdA/CDA1 family)
VRRALAVAGGVAAVQALPLLSGVPPLRRVWPWLVGRGRADHVALTFDDGPDAASTPAFVEELARLDVRATFFLLGTMCVRHPDVAKQLRDAGHELAVHSWDHRNHLRHLPGSHTRDQLARTVDVIERQTGVRPTLFRPPYGALTAAALAAARAEGLRTVLWTAWGRDWEETATAGSVADLVTRQLDGGGTVLLHDSDCTSAPLSWQATLGALPDVKRWCDEQGLALGPLREHGLVPLPRQG